MDYLKSVIASIKAIRKIRIQRTVNASEAIWAFWMGLPRLVIEIPVVSNNPHS